MVAERSMSLVSGGGDVGLIVQMTVMSSGKMKSVQDLFLKRGTLIALSFPRRPESIFDDVEMPVSILLSRIGSPGLFLTTPVNRFYTVERPSALNNSSLLNHDIRIDSSRIAKMGSAIEKGIYTKLSRLSDTVGFLARNDSETALYYQEACRYWVKANLGRPYFVRNGISMEPPHGRKLRLAGTEELSLVFCIINSSLFYWYYSVFSDCEHLNDGLLRGMPIPENWRARKWSHLAETLAADLARTAQRRTINTNQGHVITYDELRAKESKNSIDCVDEALAAAYGFNSAELDFIVNYDIKYRLGSEADVAGDE
jgi:hypothetical protein